MREEDCAIRTRASVSPSCADETRARAAADSKRRRAGRAPHPPSLARAINSINLSHCRK